VPARTSGVACLTVLLAGCALGPGMKMNEEALVSRAEKAGQKPAFVLIPLTPQVVREQSEAASQPQKRQVDPLAERAQQYEYRVAPRDVLNVIVWEHPELTIPAGEYRSPESAGPSVSRDGTIFFPHVGVIQVAGKTLPEIRELLTTRIRGLEKPQLDVKVAVFRGHRVHVTGEVKRPAVVSITDMPLRVLDALAATDGPTAEADLQNVVLSRDGKRHRLDLQAVDEQGDPTENWLLQDGDLLHVPDRSLNKVFVLGEVRKPSSRIMHKRRMNLAEALSDSEGPILESADTTGIYVIRGSYDVPRVFRLDARSPDALLLASHFPLQPLDVVFVSTHPLTQWNRIATQILPTVQMLIEPLYLVRGIGLTTLLSR
jgi:polysaccharide biosynthesis/export protein